MSSYSILVNLLSLTADKEGCTKIAEDTIDLLIVDKNKLWDRMSSKSSSGNSIREIAATAIRYCNDKKASDFWKLVVEPKLVQPLNEIWSRNNSTADHELLKIAFVFKYNPLILPDKIRDKVLDYLGEGMMKMSNGTGIYDPHYPFFLWSINLPEQLEPGIKRFFQVIDKIIDKKLPDNRWEKNIVCEMLFLFSQLLKEMNTKRLSLEFLTGPSLDVLLQELLSLESFKNMVDYTHPKQEDFTIPIQALVLASEIFRVRSKKLNDIDRQKNYLNLEGMVLDLLRSTNEVDSSNAMFVARLIIEKMPVEEVEKVISAMFSGLASRAPLVVAQAGHEIGECLEKIKQSTCFLSIKEELLALSKSKSSFVRKGVAKASVCLAASDSRFVAIKDALLNDRNRQVRELALKAVE